MRPQPNFEKSLAHRLGISVEEAKRRLEGTPPAGSPPASGSGAAEREPSQTRDTCSSSAPPFGGQATGELQRLVASWNSEEAELEQLARRLSKEGSFHDGYAVRKMADVYRRCARLLAGAIGEPRAQSVADGDEGCADQGDGYWDCSRLDRCVRPQCADCPRALSRKERSGPPNK